MRRAPIHRVRVCVRACVRAQASAANGLTNSNVILALSPLSSVKKLCVFLRVGIGFYRSIAS